MKGFLLFLLFIFFFSWLEPQKALSAPTRPTWAGAQFDEESTLEQQVEFAKESLENILAGWGYELIEESITLDSEKDIQGRDYQRYFHEGEKKEVVFYPYVLRSLHFLVRDKKREILAGSLYLVEQFDDKIKEILEFNSTLKRRKTVRKKKDFSFALVESQSPYDFKNEISHRALNLRSPKDVDFPLASSFVKVKYIRDQLSLFFRSYNLSLLPESINVDYYTDYGFVYKFADRYGQMVTLTVQDLEGKQQNVWLMLWENNASHKSSLRTQDCNSSLISTPSALDLNQKVQLVLAQGYTAEDLRNEWDKSIILKLGHDNLK